MKSLQRILAGDRINFAVPAYPGETFSGVVARISHTLDQKTRTMPVEVDVINDSARLAPGMFPEVVWPARRLRPSLLVPPSAIAVTTERTFVVRIRNGAVEWIDVKRGVSWHGRTPRGHESERKRIGPESLSNAVVIRLKKKPIRPPVLQLFPSRQTR